MFGIHCNRIIQEVLHEKWNSVQKKSKYLNQNDFIFCSRVLTNFPMKTALHWLNETLSISFIKKYVHEHQQASTEILTNKTSESLGQKNWQISSAIKEN